MNAHRTNRSKALYAGILTVTLSALAIGVGCSTSEDVPAVPTATTYYGTYTDPYYAGVMELTSVPYVVPATAGQVAADTFTITGTLKIGGVTINLAGTYDSDTGYMYFSSEDFSYTFTAQVAAGQAAGASSGPNGTGAFSLFVGGSSSNVTTYCGSASCDTPDGCTATGSFNLAVSGSVALLSVNYDGSAGVGVGTATSSDVDFHIVASGVDVTIHGSLTGGAVSGDWTDNLNDYSGSWSGSSAQCGAAPTLRRR